MFITSLLTFVVGLASVVQGAPVAREQALFTLPPLDYDYNALEPHISTAIMELHHKKHHQAAVDALNKADASYAQLEPTDVTEKIRLSSLIKFNGGSHINHSLFWKNLAPTNSPATKPYQAAPQLLKAIEATWGSYDRFQTIFIERLNAIQGSGWGWLGWDATTRELDIITLPNQDPLLTHVPIVGIDVFEHAYYLQYKNVKGDYFKAIFNVINFEEAERRFNKAVSS